MTEQTKFRDTPAVQRKMKYFGYQHLPDHLQERSKIFYDAAVKIASSEPIDYAEGIRALNKLLEAKDCFVRSFIDD